MGTDKKINYKKTLNLPKTKFSMKANLPQREPETLKRWEKEDIYRKVLKKREGSGKSFILHDGPPYANGHIHMGHVLNKILKDICVKHFTMRGYHAPYVPGWDCHGLPVEHQLFKELGITKHEIDQVRFRKKAYKYAMKFVGIQAREFKRLGIFGDWDDPYLTLTKDYEADILASLADLFEKGYIYKDLKPVNWCSRCETALAEAEVEYNEKVSPSIFVKFDSGEEINGKPVRFAIWTTTPWTLLANVAVALHPDHMYSFIDTGAEIWVADEDRASVLLEKAGVKEHDLVARKRGSELVSEYKSLRHPFIDRGSRLVEALYVTKEEGTGCVHTAPGHGQDDFLTGKKNGLPVIMPVDDRGRFMKGTGEFEGEEAVGANERIIEKMREEGTLIAFEEISHSYPHCWRCKEPIIFRATEQWFMSVDHDGLREKMRKAIDDEVEWIPARGKSRIGTMIDSRPDWCLSRQRYWGVPIPALKCRDCGEAFTDAGMIRRVAELTRRHGADVWFEKDVSELAGEEIKCPGCGSRNLKKEGDILDVWFDSGVSHRSVLEAREELSFPADLYLEGSDQHRGWFQAALITSMGIKQVPPYRKVLTHGFVVDGEGKKMSKSVGNVISPGDVMKKYGADILRLWVFSSDYEGDVKLSEEIIQRLADGYRKIRNTYRFLLSNLYDFDPEKDAVELGDMSETDRWMMSRLAALVRDINSYYEKWEFHKAYRAVYDFCVYEVSSFYLDVVKDIVYILTPRGRKRRSAQTVIFSILDILVRVMAPVMPFTAEEVWGYMRAGEMPSSVHEADWPGSDDLRGWSDPGLDGSWEKILVLRDKVLKVLETQREAGRIGGSQEAAVILYSEDAGWDSFMREKAGLFPMLFKVSSTLVADAPEQDMDDVPGLPLKVAVNRAPGNKCQRCWNWRETVGEKEDHPDLCQRCYELISERSRDA
jgi:isoleucyl-tRNA synthetase